MTGGSAVTAPVHMGLPAREGKVLMNETIRKLRLKTTALVTLMVGVILSVVLVVEYLNAYNLQAGLISASLQGRLSEGEDNWFQMGLPNSMSGKSYGRHSSVLMSLLIEISSDGVVVSAEGDSIAINTEGLSSVVERVMAGEVEGIDNDINLAWCSKESDSNMRIAVVDVSSSKSAMAKQAYSEMILFCVSLVAISAMAWVFSGFAVQPIAEAWRQQQRFIADASHELKTPLAVIKANMSVLGKDDALTPEMGRWVESTTGEADRMSSLITDMLELARADDAIESGNRGMQEGMGMLDLSQLMEETTMELDAIAFERGHVIEEDIDEGIHVFGNAEKLGRVVRILIDNATKYGSEGSPIGVSLKATKRHARVSVHNDGNPIAREDLPHVFDRFYRSDKARTADENRSFGLGLPIAKSIAEAHDGGRMTVESDAEHGTTFTMTLRLPRDRRQAQAGN